MTNPSPLVRMSAAKADIYSDAIADVMCWFRGFVAGKGEDAETPPGYRRLSELGSDLKDHADAMRSAT